MSIEAEKQEPVAWWNGKEGVVFMHEEISTPNWTDYYYIPLYTHPPKREWVGLTDEDMEELSSAWWKPNEDEMALIDWVEAKLKEKNNG